MKYNHLTVWAQDQIRWAKVAKKYSIYYVKYKNPETKKNFCSLQTTRLAKSLEHLNSSLVLMVPIQRHVRAGCFHANRLN